MVRNIFGIPVCSAKGMWGMMGVPGNRDPHFVDAWTNPHGAPFQGAPLGIGVDPAL